MKKHFFYILLMLFCNIGILQAQSTKQILQQSEQLFYQQKYTEAIAYIEKNLPHLEKGNTDYAQLLTLLGMLYGGTGNYQKGERCYLEALAIREKLTGKEHLDYLTVVSYLGSTYEADMKFAEAEECFLELQAGYEKLYGKEHEYYATALNNLGHLYETTGDFRKAEIYYTEALPIYEKTTGKEHWFYATVLNNLGNLNSIMGNYQKTEKYYLEAKPVLEKTVGMQRAMYGMLLSSLGDLYRGLRRYAEAEKYLLEGLAVYEEAVGKDVLDYAKLLLKLGDIYRETGDLQKAHSYYLNAKAIYDKSQTMDHISLYSSLGLLFYTADEFAHAVVYFNVAKQLCESVYGKEYHSYSYILNNLAISQFNRHYWLNEDTKIEADRILTNQVIKNFAFLSEQQRNLFWNVNNSLLFEATYSFSNAHPSTSMVAHAYNNTLFTKGLLLRTTNGVRDAIYSSGSQSLISQYEQLGNLRQNISALQKKEDPNMRLLAKLENRADSLDKILTAASGAYREIGEDMSMKWQNIQASLQPDEAAIEFVRFRYFNKWMTDSVLYCAMILKKDSKAPAWISLCNEQQLQALTAREEDISDEDYTQMLYQGMKGNKLYHLVWQPLEKELNGVRTIYYSPAGMLHQIAFAAVQTGNSSVLSDKYDLQLVSSTREIVRLKTEQAGSFPQGTAAIYGGLWYDADRNRLIAEAGKATYDPNDDQNIEPTLIAAAIHGNLSRGMSWDYLPGTAAEADSISNCLSEYNIANRLYTETAGNEESFMSLSGTPAGIIHMATHGFFLEDVENDSHREIMQRIGGNVNKAAENPLLRSGLLMAGANRAWTGEGVIDSIADGILTADEIARMNLIKTRLAVLSACETGLGEVKNAEGVFGLQRAFKLAGVETLVMSLWAVPDEVTSELMSAFYKGWLAGNTKHEAFSAARQQVRRKYKKICCWAGFVMMD